MAAFDSVPDVATEAAGYNTAWDILYSFIPSMLCKTAVLLGIPDIIAKAGAGATLTVEQIAAELPSEHPNLNALSRILHFLACKGILTLSSSVQNAEGSELRFGLTEVARFFVVHDNPETLSPFLLLKLDETFQTPWHHFDECVLEGGDPFQKVHGKDQWSYMAENAHLSDVFNAGMASLTAGVMQRIFEFYDGFKHIHSLVDVGGGTGQALSYIVKAFPQIQAINFDLPHVVATAPNIPGVRHVGGNMFESVPSADAVYLKTVLHNWDDEGCLQILLNCHKALPPHGRLIITEMVIDEANLSSPIEQRKLEMDLAIAAHTGKGRERTEEQWRQLLSSAGFTNVEIYGIECLYSVVEAFTA